MFAPLPALRWHRLRVDLRCTRNTFAREHPLAIFDAIFRGAAARRCPPPDQPWIFHPLQPLGDRIRAGRVYPLALIFPSSSGEVVAEFSRRLATYLAEPRRNFELVQALPPETRSLAEMEQETAELEQAPGEVCLEFLTPLAFRPPDPRRRWLITVPTLFEGLARRVERLWGVRLDWPAGALDGLRLLPCCWHYVEHRHASKSSAGAEFLNGCVGPLYLQGELAPWLPLLRLGQEVHVAGMDGRGHRLAFGAGAYRLRDRLPFFAATLLNPQTWRETLAEMAEESAEPDPLLHALDREEALTALLAELREGRWTPEAARGFLIEKQPARPKGGGEAGTQMPDAGGRMPDAGHRGAEASPVAAAGAPQARLIAELSSRDRLIHRVLHRVLSPVWDRLFESNSHGFRPGRSTADARRAVLSHVREGCAWVVETDVATFFDRVDWDLLDEAVGRALPQGDTLAGALVRRAVRTPLEVHGRPVDRRLGLLQGSPLSPLLANLYLDPFDEAAAQAGLRLVRYADDLLVLCPTETEATSGLATMQRLLAPLRLELNAAKTAITPVAAGFTFLGHTFAPELTEDFLERTTLRKPVYIPPDYAFVGVDEQGLILRRDGELAGRVPLRRAGEIHVYGAHAISTPLLQRCAAQGIPVSFCTAAGWHIATLRPDSRLHFELAARHWLRHTQLDPAARLGQAREVLAAKLANALAWVRETAGDPLAPRLDHTLARLETAGEVDALRGMEGDAARRLFRWVNDRVRDADFRSPGRVPRQKADRWNCLLDFAYSRLFARLNVFIRARGLNPYLGWLHSAADYYESLVCDLQEPFRPRCDRWVLRVVNRKQVAADDFEAHPAGGWRLTLPAMRRMFEVWEEEMDTRWATDAGTLEQLLHAQVEAVREWALGADRVRLYRAHGRHGPFGAPKRPDAATEQLVEDAFSAAGAGAPTTAPGGPATQEAPPISETSPETGLERDKTGEVSEKPGIDGWESTV